MVRDYMRHLNIDIGKAWDIFRLLDEDSSGSLTAKEFIGGCLKLRGPAKTTDIAAVHKDLRELKKSLAKFAGNVHESFVKLGVGKARSSRQSSPSRTSFEPTAKKAGDTTSFDM